MKKSILFVLCMFSATQSFGWGAVGHKATAYIGESYLTPEARAKVNDLLDGQRLSDVVNWADSLRGQTEYSQTFPLHYQNMPEVDDDTPKKKENYYRKSIVLQNGHEYSPGVVEAILTAEKNLLNPLVSREKKQMSLKFLVHFIGDLHQPLHTGRAADRGGNSIKIAWRGKDTNLHKLWDSDMIYENLNKIPNADGKDPGLVYAQQLVNTYKNMGITKEGVEDVSKWYRESLTLQTLAYDSKVESDQDGYYAKARPTVDARVFLAGRRMGETLNRLFVTETMAPPHQQLIKMLEKMFGALEELVSLQAR